MNEGILWDIANLLGIIALSGSAMALVFDIKWLRKVSIILAVSNLVFLALISFWF